jgi:hypothetical protein
VFACQARDSNSPKEYRQSNSELELWLVLGYDNTDQSVGLAWDSNSPPLSHMVRGAVSGLARASTNQKNVLME